VYLQDHLHVDFAGVLAARIAGDEIQNNVPWEVCILSVKSASLPAPNTCPFVLAAGKRCMWEPTKDSRKEFVAKHGDATWSKKGVLPEPDRAAMQENMRGRV